MRFWDTSAIVPLCVLESTTPEIRHLTNSDPGLVVWWGTRTECVSAIARRRREGVLTDDDERQAREILATLSASWSEILAHEQLRTRAERLLAVHPLRAADAFQLAAALVWSEDQASSHTFVSFDECLRRAAAREGFDVLPTGGK